MKKSIMVAAFLLLCFMLSAGNLPNGKCRYQGDVLLYGYAVTQSNTKGYAASVETVHGVDFGNGLFVGLGTGLKYSFTNLETFVPVYAEGRYYFNPSRIRPFVSLSLGGEFCLARPDNSVLVSPAFGLYIGSFAIKFGYCYNAGFCEAGTYNLNSIRLGVGYAFGARHKK